MHPESGRLLASPLPDGLFLEEAAYTKIVEESGIENTANYLLQFPDFRDHTNLARLHFALMDIVAGEDLDQMLMLMRKFGRTNEHGSITICFTEIVKRNQRDSFSSLKEFMDLGAGSYTAISAEPFFSGLLASGLSYKEILERTMSITGSREIPDYLASNYFSDQKRPLEIDSEDWEFVANYLQTADIIGIDEYLKRFFGLYD